MCLFRWRSPVISTLIYLALATRYTVQAAGLCVCGGGGGSGGRVEVEVEGRLLLLVFVCALLTRAWRFETQHFFFLRLPFLQDSVVVLKTNVSVML